MGTEALWIPIALAAASTGVSYYNNKQLENRQDDILVHGIQQQRKRQGDVNKATDELLSKFATSNAEGDKAKANAAYTQALAANKPMVNAGLTKVGGASKDYAAGSQDAALGVADYGKLLSGLMSRIEAPQDQRAREGVMLGNYGVEVDRQGRMSRGDDYINQLRLKAQRSNPWLSALSAALQGAATATGSGEGGGLMSLFGAKAPVDFGIPLPGSGRLPGF
jgi:hypothetical protein